MSGALTFAKFVEFLKRSTVRGDMHFIFQPKDMVNLCLNLNESQPIYAYKCYAYKKRVYLHSSQKQTNLVVQFHLPTLPLNKMQTFLFMKNRPSFLPGPLMYFQEKNFCGKK